MRNSCAPAQFLAGTSVAEVVAQSAGSSFPNRVPLLPPQLVSGRAVAGPSLKTVSFPKMADGGDGTGEVAGAGGAAPMKPPEFARVRFRARCAVCLYWAGRTIRARFESYT